MTPWLEFVSEKLKDELRGPKKVAERHGAADFVEWADASKVPFPPTESVDEILSRYSNTLDAYKGPRGLSKKGRVALEMAKRILTMAKEAAQGATQGAAQETDVSAKPDSASAKPDVDESFSEEENEMPRTPRQQEELNEELLEEEEEEGSELEEEMEEEELEEEPPRKRRRNASQQRIVVQLPPQRRASVGRAEPRSSSLRSILPRTEKIRLYKRDELGKRQHIEDYSADEIGNIPLETFLRNYVNPNFHNESGVTEYIAYELDARTGREKMPPAVITIETPVEESTDAFGQVRKAMGLINDLQQVAAPQQASANVDLLRRAQADAAGRGDMNSMMMLLMMERLMTGGGAAQNSHADLLLKVLDRLDKMERRSNGGASNGEFGPPSGFGGFMPPPPPYMPPPLAPPPPTTTSQPPPAPPVGLSSLERVVELALAQMVKPPKALTEQVQEMMALKQLTSSSDEVQQLRQQIAALQAQLAGSRTSSGIEDSLANFEKFTSIVKSVAPQVTGNDGGFFKGLLTSEMGKILGDIVAKAAQQAGTAQAQQSQQSQQQPQQQSQQSQQQPQQQQQVSASPQPKSETSSNGPPAPPQAVVDAVRAFSVAQTPEAQAQRFVDVVLQMYTSGVPHYRQLLDPALEALNNSDKSVNALNVARKTALALVREIRPQIATPEFIDKCIAALVAKAGAEMPETLLKTNGKWTADYMGNVLLLEQVGAKPVVEESSTKPSNGASPGEVQSPVETKPLPLTDVVEAPTQRIEAPEPARA
jgi:hypothetical protein